MIKRALIFAHAAAVAILAVAILILAIAPRAHGARNLLLNGDLSTGSESQPDHWRTEAWRNDPSSFAYTWTHPQNGGPGELKVVAIVANDARWMQSLTLAPGWYHITAEVRTENVGVQADGASISLMESGIMSADIRGTSAWQPVGFYVKVSGHGADVEVAARLGGYSSLNTGTAYFRNIQAVKIAAPPKGATHVFDLMAIRKQSEEKPVGKPITLVAVFVALAIVAGYGWWLFGREDPPAAVIAQSRPVRRAGQRRAR